MSYKPLTFNLPTIYALATSSLQKSAIAIIRVSGSQSSYIYQKLTKRPDNNLLPRKSYLRKIYNAQGSFIDESMILFFQGPHSFTGEDSLEIHCHGGRALIESILGHISALNRRKVAGDEISIRYATNGEFAQRSFQNGKRKLLELESINDSINATTWQELKSINQTQTDIFQEWKGTLIDCIAKLTAYTDFINTDIDEEFEPGNTLENEEFSKIFTSIQDEIATLYGVVNKFYKNLVNSNLLKDGIRVSIIGSPNVGKSSLLNKLNNDEIAIVSDIPGTTRDAIDTVLDVKGFKTIICDTAGIRDQSTDPIEKIGISKSKKKISDSNIVFYMLDITNPVVDPNLLKIMSNKRIIFILNKIDLVTSSNELAKIKDDLDREIRAMAPNLSQPNAIIPISCKSTADIDKLINELVKTFHTMLDQDSDPLIMSQRVQDIILNDILFNLDAFLHDKSRDITISCGYLQDCLDAIAKILGESIGIDDILDKVFKQFCVGK